MALQLLSTPLADARPRKRRLLGWDVGPVVSDDSSYLQLQIATQISLAQNSQSVQYAAANDLSLGDNQGPWMHNRDTGSTIWREDDKDGHLQFDIGDVLCSRYKVVRKMGEGTFGRVLECQDFQTQEFVAVKVIRSPQKYREAAMIEINILNMLHLNDKNGTRFVFILVALTSLGTTSEFGKLNASDNSRGCVEIKNWFDFRNHICIVFDKLGPSLYEFLRANNYRSYLVDDVREFGRQLLESVTYMHSLRLIHTDLKPENILLVSSEYVKVSDHKNSSKYTIEMKRAPKSSRIKLIDFGSATYDREDSYSIVSTRHYRAPEVILGLGWSYPCDIWSVGCILVELCSGEALFQTHENLEHLAMMERVLGPIPSSIIRRATWCSEKYFKHAGRELNWPDGASSRESIKAVRRLPRLQNLIMEHADHSAGLLIDLLEKLLKYDAKERLTAKEALEHPFFRISARR